MMNKVLYTPEGYIDMRALIMNERSPFIFITSLRGPGKTWGAIDYALRCQDKPFILMRRTQVQADFAAAPATTPLAANLRDDEYLDPVKTGVKNFAQLNVMQKADPEDILVGTCYIIALSTVATMRGISLMGCDILIFDEFIKEPHERPIKEEYLAFTHAYETINRNRESQGRPALKVIALSNALDLANPYYRGFDLVNRVYAMTSEILRDPDQGVAIYRPRCQEFWRRKKTGVLYKLRGTQRTSAGDWADMNLDKVKSLRLKSSAVPICSINGVGFWKVNGEGYASAIRPNGVPAYDLDDRIDVAAVHMKNQGLINALFNRKVVFESVDIMLRCGELVQRL